MNNDKAMYAIEAEKLKTAVVYIFLLMERAATDDDGLARFRVRGPEYAGDDYLIVGGAIAEDGTPVVCFHTASSLDDVLIGFANRLRNGSIKWHVDKYATGQAKQAVQDSK